jgi:hypothetical protein
VYLSELADIADALALECAEVCGDATVLEVEDSSERLIEQGPGSHGLWPLQGVSNLSRWPRSIKDLQPRCESLP